MIVPVYEVRLVLKVNERARHDNAPDASTHCNDIVLSEQDGVVITGMQECVP